MKIIVRHLNIGDASRDTAVRAFDVVDSDKIVYFSDSRYVDYEADDFEIRTLLQNMEMRVTTMICPYIPIQLTTTRNGRVARQFILQFLNHIMFASVGCLSICSSFHNYIY